MTHHTYIYGFMVCEQPVESYFDYIVTHEIHHLEIDLKKKHSLLKTFTPERIAVIKEFCEKNDVSLSLHPPYNINLCTQGWLVRYYHIAYLKKCIGLAGRLGARYITLHLGNFHRAATWSNPRQHALERLVKALAKLLPDCAGANVFLALENVVPIPPEVGFAFVGDNIKDFQYIFSSLVSDKIKFCLDIGHANTHEGPLAYVEKLSEKIIGVHFHDNRGRHDEHLDVGKGTAPWGALIEALAKTGFYGPYVSECFKSQPHEAIALLKSFCGGGLHPRQ
jgi:sugar phosphate isomerase/epimerase